MRRLLMRPRTQHDLGASLTIWLLLSLGLGAAALLYTALDRLLIHPLNVPHPETLVRAVESHPPVTSWQWFPYSTYQAMQQMRSLQDVAVEGDVDTVFTSASGKQPVFAHMVSGNYFSLMGTAAELGRTFTGADELKNLGAIPVVLSHRFWTSEFGNASTVIGSTIFLQDQPFTVVGVMPSSFYGTMLDSSPDLWLPVTAQPLLSNKSLNDPETDRYFSIIGRLRSGVYPGQAQAEFSGIFRTLQKMQGDADPKRQGLIAPAVQGTFSLRTQFSHALNLLLCGLATLLLMICANVAGLLLARQARKERDIAVRMALGAGRSRLVFHAFTGSITLGLAGACGGIAVAYLCAPLLMSLLPAGRAPLPVSLIPDWKIGLMAAALAVIISLIFGVLPAWSASRVAPQQALRSGTSTRRAGSLSRWLLILQTGAALVLLAGTGLLIRTFYILRHTSPGFDVEHLITFTLNPGLKGRSPQVSATFPTELQQRIQALPGVSNASLANAALMQRIGMKTSVALPGQKISSASFLNTSLDAVSSTFFDTMGIPILSGHSLSAADANRSGPIPTVINEAFARLIFPNVNPIGRTFGMGAPGEIAKATNIVVGVAGDSKYRSLREDLLPIYYAPINQRSDWGSQFYLYVRTQGPPDAIVHAARKVLSDLDPQLSFSSIITMQEQVSASLWQERLLAVLASIFSVISILMASMGLYGLFSYDTSQRTREFGIRNAVGAQKIDIAKLLFRDLARIVVPGMMLGFAASLLLARIIRSALYGIKPDDPISLLAGLVAITAIGLIAIWQPIRRAMNVEPAVILREE